MKMKFRNNYRIYQILFTTVILSILVSACKTTKETGGTIMKEKNSMDFLQGIIDNSLQFQTLTAKVNVDIKPGKKNKNVSSNANFKLIKNERMQLSFQPLFGYEVFRIIISKDSVILLDRMNKQYVAETINDIKDVASFDFNFNNLQALFTNQLFLSGQTQITQSDFPKFLIEQFSKNATIKSKDKQINYVFTSDYTEKIRSTEMTNKSGTTTMHWAYDDFSKISDAQLFPMKMKMDLNLPKDVINMNLAFSKIELNNNVDIDLSIPSKYKRISLSQAILIIQNL